jgi:hypothetical protein
MKKIITSNVVDPSILQPFTAQSLRFLQEAKEDDVAGLIKALVISNLASYSLGTPYVISGCVVSDSGKDVTAGEIFYGGKYYETTAVNGTTNVARFILTPSQDATADPLTFSDSSVFNVHTIYKYVPTDVVSGGDFTSANLVDLYTGSSNKFTFYAERLTARNETTGTPPINTAAEIFTFTTPNDGKTRDVLITLVSKLDATYAGFPFGYNTNIKQATVLVNTTGIIQLPAGNVGNHVHNYLAMSVPPNTVFSIEDFRSASTKGTVYSSSLSVISLF